MVSPEQPGEENPFAFLSKLETDHTAQPSRPVAQPSRPVERRVKTSDDPRETEVMNFLQGLGGQGTDAKAPNKQLASAVTNANRPIATVTIHPESKDDNVPVAYGPPALSKPSQERAPEPYELADKSLVASEPPGENSKRIRDEKNKGSPFVDAAVASAKNDIKFWVKAASKWAKDNLNGGVPLTQEQINDMGKAFAQEYVQRQAKENTQVRG